MKDWWLSKTPREQLMLTAAAAVTLLFLIYLLAWQPFMASVEQKRLQVNSQQITLDWMKSQLPEVQQLRARVRASGPRRSNEALLTLVDRTANQSQLRQQIKTIKPQGENRVQIWVEQAPFDTLMKWLGGLSAGHGIQIASLTVDRQELTGIVNARLVLERGGNS
jgi:general secretion pathway protein M